MSFCRRITAIRLDGNYLTAIPLRCKCWTCPECAPWRKKKLIAQILSGSPMTFITLTWKPREGFSPDQAAQIMSKAFGRLTTKIRKEFDGHPFEFAAVWEATKSGMPHMHIVARAPFIPQPWLSREWHRLTASYIVDIRTIKDPHKAAVYVAKYISKSPHHFQGTKRYRFSFNYKPEGDESTPGLLPPESGWQFAKIALPTLRIPLQKLTTPSESATSPDCYIGEVKPDVAADLDRIQMNSPERLTGLLDMLRGNIPEGFETVQPYLKRADYEAQCRHDEQFPPP